MSDKYDRVTREGLETFSKLCKKRFVSEQIVINSNSYNPAYLALSFNNVSNMADLKIKISGGDNFLTLININKDTQDKSSIFNAGKAQAKWLSYLFQDECLYIKIALGEYVDYITLACQVVNGDTAYYVEPDYLKITGTSTEYSQTVQASNASGVSDTPELYVKTDEKNYITYPNVHLIDTIWKAKQLDHNIKFELTTNASDVSTNGYDLSGDTIYIRATEQSLGNNCSGVFDTVTVVNGLVTDGQTSGYATKSVPGKVMIDGDGLETPNLPLKITKSGYAYVTLPTSIFTYKGSVDKYESLPNSAKEGDVYTVKSGEDPEDVGSEYVRVKKDDGNYYWEYVGQKVKFEGYHYTNTTPMPAAIGGLAKGTTFEKMELDDVLNRLLYPYVKFTWSVSATPNVFEYGTQPPSIVFEANVTNGSEKYTITPVSGVYTLIPSDNLTTNQSYKFTVTDNKITEEKTATASVGYYVDLFYSPTVLSSLNITSNSSSGKLYTQSPSNKTLTATSTVVQNLYFVCPTAWWVDGKTLSSSVGSVNAAATRQVTRNTCSYTIAYLGQFSGTSSYIINKS